MARKARTSKRVVKKAKATTAAPARPTGSTDLRTVHHRVTVPRACHLDHGDAALAQAILQNCERDYMTLQQVFGGLTPQRMPFVVQITGGATGASHSSCMGTDIAVGGKSGPDVDFIRSLLVAEADEVFMANFGHGWDCGASNGEGLSRVVANDISRASSRPASSRRTPGSTVRERTTSIRPIRATRTIRRSAARSCF